MTLSKKNIFHKRHDVDMTQGSILKCILLFAFPLLIGNLFQQLYNMVDTWVIGQSGHNGAYAAVGSVGPIINILIGFFVGLSSGTTVVVSQFYGAKEEKKVHDAVHTAIAATFVMGIICTVIGVIFTPALLKLMLHGADGEIYPQASIYLRIYFSGIMGLMLYNMASGILRAVGDSKRPFYFLVVSSIVNIILDVLFVFCLGMTADGVALATVIAQWISAILAVLTLLKNESCIKLIFKDIKLDRKMLEKIIYIGFPAGIQMAITAFSNVFVQSYIANVNGNITHILGGWTSYSKIDMFMFLPVQSIALSVTTFVGQNVGVGNYKRAKKGTFNALFVSLGVNCVLIVLTMLFSPYLVKIFNSDSEVVRYGSMLLVWLSPFYIFTCVNQIFAASLRGMGNSTAPMIIMLSSFVGFRQLYLYVVSNYISNEILPIGFSYPAGWFVCMCVISIYYFLYKPKKNIIIDS